MEFAVMGMVMLTQPEGMVGLLWRFSKGEEKATPARRRTAGRCKMGFILLLVVVQMLSCLSKKGFG